MTSIDPWPSLRYENWNDTIDSLHMKLQIIGKVKLALNPFLNQWWHVAFYLNMKGMATGLIPYEDLDYQEVIESQNPEESILKFLNETYDIGSIAAKWDIES